MKRRAPKPRWHPVSRPPRNLPPGSTVWFYHPTYTHRRVRPGSVDLFVYTTDATHWCPYVDSVPPSPP